MFENCIMTWVFTKTGAGVVGFFVTAAMVVGIVWLLGGT